MLIDNGMRSQILDYNTRLRAGFEQGIAATSVMEIWDAMQIELAVVLNSDLPGLSPLLQPQRRVRYCSRADLSPLVIALMSVAMFSG